MRGQDQKSWVASVKTFKHAWYVVDAADKILGRLATRVAGILMGKHKPTYTPFLDAGDFVIVVNAEKVRLSGRKSEKKVYQTFSTYPGGRKEIPYRTLVSRYPERVVELAVKRMLPQTTLGGQMVHKLKVYRGPSHPHQAQQPEPLTV